jgi:tripartite-type tricarboxylate transporter receptor subunit TctC
MMTRRAILGRAFAGLFVTGLLTCLQPASVRAQAYPSRPVTIVVPLAAGTGMDSVVRLYAEELAKSLSVAVVVENQPGAAMMAATSSVSRATPDGHTLLVAAAAPLAINQTLYKKINYDPDADLTPISLYLKSPFVLVTPKPGGAATFADFLTQAKASAAAPFTYSTPGAGFLQHLTMEFLKKNLGFDATHVAYRSSPQSINDVVGGHIKVSFAEMGASLSLIREGQLQALAVTSATRLTSLPDIPTLGEAAKLTGYEAVSWHVLLAPAATPKETVDRLHTEMKRITGDKAFQAKLTAIGLLPVDTASIDDIRTYIRSERARWGGVVKDLGLEGSQ